MKISVEELKRNDKEYIQNAPHYINGYIFVQSGTTSKDVKAIEKYCRRLCADNEGIHFLLVSSSHDSKHVNTRIIRTGKKGRPRKIKTGLKIDRHIHGLIVNTDDKCADKTNSLRLKQSQYLNKRRKKRTHLKQAKAMQIDNSPLLIVKYMDRQADNTYCDPEFDWDYFRDEKYFDWEREEEYVWQRAEKTDIFEDILDFE